MSTFEEALRMAKYIGRSFDPEMDQVFKGFEYMMVCFPSSRLARLYDQFYRESMIEFGCKLTGEIGE